MQIPLLSGVLASEQADFNLSMPINLEGVSIDTGISKGYLRSAMGATTLGAGGPGVDRGGILFNGLLHRVMGTKLVSVSSSGVVTVLGDVGGTGPVALDFGFGRLAIQSGTNLYYWDGATLVQVTDPDLGPCIDVAWFNGQYFSTDGTYIVATNINDPTVVDPLKYGSAEQDPDGINGLLRIRNELAVTGGETIEFFDYVGGAGFPLQVNSGATIPIGCAGSRAKCIFSQTFAFVGAGRNQSNGVWLAGGGTAEKLSTRAIDDFLAAEPNPSGIELESRVSRDEERLYVHLSDKTLVYLRQASTAAQQQIWYVARSGLGMDKAYRLRHAVLFNNEWIVGDTETASLGVLSEAEATHFGEAVGWRFDTRLTYNSGNGFIVHQLELVGLPGRGTTGNPVAYLSTTLDGETWSLERANRIGLSGQRRKRIVWNQHNRARNYMGMRFRGSSSALAGWAALEAQIEGLNA